MLTKNGGMITNDVSSECIIMYNAFCTIHTVGTKYCKRCYEIVLSTPSDYKQMNLVPTNLIQAHIHVLSHTLYGKL